MNPKLLTGMRHLLYLAIEQYRNIGFTQTECQVVRNLIAGQSGQGGVPLLRKRVAQAQPSRRAGRLENHSRQTQAR